MSSNLVNLKTVRAFYFENLLHVGADGCVRSTVVKILNIKTKEAKLKIQQLWARLEARDCNQAIWENVSVCFLCIFDCVCIYLSISVKCRLADDLCKCSTRHIIITEAERAEQQQQQRVTTVLTSPSVSKSDANVLYIIKTQIITQTINKQTLCDEDQKQLFPPQNFYFPVHF